MDERSTLEIRANTNQLATSRRAFRYIVQTAALVGILTFTASAGANSPQKSVAAAAAKVRNLLQRGEASWYGRAVQGHLTASGERFDLRAMTCAHRTLPLGSWLRVTNLLNRESVLVRVTDRGPMVHHRIVDLSYAAAQAVGIGGIGNVELEALNPSDPAIASLIAGRIAQNMMIGPTSMLGLR